MKEYAAVTRRAALLTTLGLLMAMPAPLIADAAANSALQSETVTLENGHQGLLVRPAGGGRRPALLVLPDDSGSLEPFQDIARQFATAGFVVLAIDPGGGRPVGDIKLDAALTIASAAVAHLARRPDGNGRVGVVGFGWGAGVAGHLAVVDPTVGATVSYYGTQPLYHLRDAYSAMNSTLLFHYAGRDTALNVGIETFKDELNVAKKPYTIHVYPGTQRGFAEAAKPRVFDKAAADLAWQRTLKFLESLR
jgi:carboxymethylenebutenolidase